MRSARFIGRSCEAAGPGASYTAIYTSVMPKVSGSAGDAFGNAARRMSLLMFLRVVSSS